MAIASSFWKSLAKLGRKTALLVGVCFFCSILVTYRYPKKLRSCKALAILFLMNDTTSPHILIVDDDREIRDLLARFLIKHGLRVSTAKDGVEMMSVLGEGAIDLIVLDLMMPGEDGLVLCRRS